VTRKSQFFGKPEAIDCKFPVVQKKKELSCFVALSFAGKASPQFREVLEYIEPP